MSNAIWVVVANDNTAAICASTEGSSRLVSVVSRKVKYTSVDAARMFALQIMSELHRGLRDGTCGGVVLIAGQTLLEKLGEIALPEVTRHLVARIVGEPDGELDVSRGLALAAEGSFACL